MEDHGPADPGLAQVGGGEGGDRGTATDESPDGYLTWAA